ncbi:MAG: hypothetical protein AAFN78_04920 [Pseudomonadota bacterium]
MHSTASASVLADTAQALAPGEFVELATEGLTRDLMTAGGCSSPVTSFSDNGVWDAPRKAFLFVGGPHGCPHVFLRYSEADNSWSTLPTYSDRATHGYDHTTIDIDTNTLYFRTHSKGGIHSYDLEAGTWQVDALEPPAMKSVQVSGGLEYFPELGRLVLMNYGGQGGLLAHTGKKWRREGSEEMGTRANFIEYNPNHGVLLFGGGWIAPKTFSPKAYLMNGDGKIKATAEAPVGLGITASIITVDPVSGRFLVFANRGVFAEYDPEGDAWRTLDRRVPFLETHYQRGKASVATVAAPIPEYGVMMFLQYLGSGKGGPKAWLYRHCTDGPDCAGAVAEND